MGPWMMGYGWMWIMPVIWIIIIGLVVWGIISLVRYISSSSRKQENSALEVLKVRYAHGEINKAEYEEKKKDLS